MGVDASVYSGKWVQACLTAGGGMFPSLDLMSTPLELAPIPLESAPLETAKTSSACATLEAVVLGVCEYFLSGVCECCVIFSGP